MHDAAIQVVRSGAEALPAVSALLDAAALPTHGLGADEATALLTASADGAVVGAAAVELYQPEGLLRSVVVAAAQRGAGIGRLLVSAAEATARAEGVRTLFLLTEGAGGFFDQLGYRTIDRHNVPLTIRNSDEYSVICPSDAAVMMKRLGD